MPRRFHTADDPFRRPKAGNLLDGPELRESGRAQRLYPTWRMARRRSRCLKFASRKPYGGPNTRLMEANEAATRPAEGGRHITCSMSSVLVRLVRAEGGDGT